MITKMPLRIARTLFPLNLPGSQISLPQSLIEINQLLQLKEKENLFETVTINNNPQLCEQLRWNGFKFKDFEDQLRIELSKNVENVQILICIDFQNRQQSIETDIIDSQIVQIQGSSEISLSSLQRTSSPFSIYLTKGNGIISCYECLALNGKITIEMISIIDDIEEHKQISRECRGLEDYNGSNHLIDESIQQEMLNYLKTFEIDSELAQFVQHIQLQKEQVLNEIYLKSKAVLHD
ncbi:unnamed protein product (macronuclear) [Paramecium tetraurelia]|uniref:Uncharacterized protein n=1 Tax=Paramecium tetraurelia TaxID=5888 RepID=A0DSR5_PARTE|nr:uncharacterized protein GSPATT00019775001 [Paramecium tetraurelia]CAK86082.1 unnamed protein product [Paramecium tetraurelia]|eukprot:XP_001453479.1 hypothetical protein (macronuclear) [Paramecium tetraurelia strain d4-2]